MNAEEFLSRVRFGRHYRDQIASVRKVDRRVATYIEPSTPLPPALRDLLRQHGIEQLYSHQALAFDAVRSGEHVVIATGTASGKSICYQLPTFASLIDDPDARALFLFPAKALAYDQLGTLERMVAIGGLADVIRPACYDGDTPSHKRPGIRRTASILLTNPDMLHQSIMPYHAKWAGLLARLKIVVLDEIHTYRGIFGSHVAGVVRRLQRLCRHYGADPRFVCCSATVGNPRELAERLINRDVRLIDEDGSPRGAKWVVMWNPPWEDAGPKARVSNPTGRDSDTVAAATHVDVGPATSTALAVRAGAASEGNRKKSDLAVAGVAVPQISRRSANVEAQYLFQTLLEEGAGTILFTKARVVAELIYKYVVESLERRRPDLVKKIRPYRGGYLPNERREIERKLFSGELLGVCSTNALELGIDVGSLDAAIIVGFPGTLCSLWQQAGRAGRRQDDSLVIYVAYDDPIDQYLMRNAAFVFDRPLERAVIDPDNPHILAAQLGCAAFELPLTDRDLSEFGVLASEVTIALCEENRLRHTADRYYWASSEFAAAQMSLRTISNATFSILDITKGRNEVLGQVDSISAPELVYPEAIYLHQAESFIVRELDWQARTAKVERFDADYYTQPVLGSDCRIVEERERGEVLAGGRWFGDVVVQWQTIAFRKFKYQTMELIGQTKLELPAQRINTRGVWFQPPAHALAAAKDAGYRAWEALAGVRNLMVVALPTLAMCDRYDIGGVVDSTQLGVSTIILYDRYEGGVGYARHGFDFSEDLLRLAYDLVRGCPCEDGCPGCVAPPNLRIAIHHDPDLYRGYEIPDKAATLVLLAEWCGR